MPNNLQKPRNLQPDSVFPLPNSQSLRLQRYPDYQREQLRAWDAADEYLLNHISEHKLVEKNTCALIVNDAFGALILGIKAQEAEASIHGVNDSFSARQGLLANAEINNLDLGSFQCTNSLSIAPVESAKTDLILIKIPKSLAHLELQLSQLKPFISDATVVVAVGMVKTIHSSTLKIFENVIGRTTTSLARKKARLIFSEPDLERIDEPHEANPLERKISADETASGHPISLMSYPGVFAHGKLDIGTRFLLENLNIPQSSEKILDLGCGSGVMGIAAALQNQTTKVTFVDDSYLAVESAKLSVKQSIPENRQEDMFFLTTHSMWGIEDESQDLILNNPPFHDAGAKTSNIALDMFKDSKRVLKKGGQLIVIANRNLGYHMHLKRIFGNCETVKGNKKFVILISIK